MLYEICLAFGMFMLSVESCEHDNKPAGSIKGGKTLDWLGDSYLPKNDCSEKLHRVGLRCIEACSNLVCRLL